MTHDDRTARRTTPAGVVVSALVVAAVAALVALVVPHVVSGDTDPAQPSDVPSSCLTPTSDGSDADWTICWDD